jgi:hypothetical protein
MHALLSVLVTGTLACADPTATAMTSASIPTPAQILLQSPDRRVRATDPRVQSLLLEGMRRSATFSTLLTALNRTDVIVYVERLMTLPKETLGLSLDLNATCGSRFAPTSRSTKRLRSSAMRCNTRSKWRVTRK